MSDPILDLGPSSGARERVADRRVVEALRVSMAFGAMTEAWEAALDQIVFGRVIPHDRKEIAAFERTLRDTQSYRFLSGIWKESDLVSCRELDQLGLERNFPGGPTLHAVAVQAEPASKDLGKVEKRLKAIADAAEAFGLLERKELGPKKKPLAGTALLHTLMLAVHEDHARQIAAAAADLGGAPGRFS